MDPTAFRRHGHQLVDRIADYFEQVEKYPVLSRNRPGDVAAALPPDAPEDGEPFDSIMADFERVIVPGLTHWNQPGFFAYFAITGSAPGVLADFLSAALNQQAMLWRTSPAATELEGVTLAWLRRLVGLPDPFEGVIYDTASISTMHALIGARETATPNVRKKGLAGRSDVQPDSVGGADVRDLRHRVDARRRGGADSGDDGNREPAGGAILSHGRTQQIGAHPECIIRGNFSERVVAEADRNHGLVDR